MIFKPCSQPIIALLGCLECMERATYVLYINTRF